VTISLVLIAGLTLLALIPRLPAPAFDRVIRESRWKREEKRWREGSAPEEVVRTYRSKGEMDCDRDRLTELGYQVLDEHWEVHEDGGAAGMPSRDELAAARLRAQARLRAAGPEITVTYRRDPVPSPLRGG
jgi:hypothetical protein